MYRGLAGSVVVKKPAFPKGVVVIPVNMRWRIVGPRLPLIPRDVLVARLALFQADVAARAGFYRIYGPNGIPDVTRREEKEAVLGEWRGNDDGRHPTQFPQQFAVQVVRANLPRARGNDLGAPVVLPNVRRGPVAGFVAFYPPALLACLFFEHSHKGPSLVLVFHVAR